MTTSANKDSLRDRLSEEYFRAQRHLEPSDRDIFQAGWDAAVEHAHGPLREALEKITWQLTERFSEGGHWTYHNEEVQRIARDALAKLEEKE
jgi:hypothetical protein